jgi:hypothetical protein
MLLLAAVTYIKLFSAAHALVYTYGPYKYSLKECEAQVELLVRMIMLPPVDPEFTGATFQCFKNKTARKSK